MSRRIVSRGEAPSAAVVRVCCCASAVLVEVLVVEVCGMHRRMRSVASVIHGSFPWYLPHTVER